MIDLGKLRELAAEMGYWPATTDLEDIDRHRRANRALSAERGWIAQPPPPPPRDYIPGEEHKWRIMMGRGTFLPTRSDVEHEQNSSDD